ncbi:stAR-related lipid transfer protein 3-like isoform X1 [Centruroides sculpturatus]|uniref:stAR-related lipid transfer protein 3-like isoform X1 n=2 Tax=Centruroides sculpturatus TaxID=218467 RepID=UPI000C6EDB62|nr:stAR-related lipid transfer protein 3-like isoform X1 [Centruroides sculpturatus]
MQFIRAIKSTGSSIFCVRKKMGNYGSKSLQSFPPLRPSMRTDYQSINSAYSTLYLNHFNDEDLKIGTSLAGQMSPVRRFFCLLTTFDLLFTFLLWLISTMMEGRIASVREEVLNYTIRTSYFDIVLLSVWRFILLISAYALFRISHWWVVAITTAGSGAFIITKVFLFDLSHLNHIASIILLICSFIISWGEAWFLDFKVVPSEMNARILLAYHVNEGIPRIPDQNAQSDAGSTCFFSPTASEIGNDNEYERKNEDFKVDLEGIYQDQTRRNLTTEELIHKKRAEECLEKALSILTSSSWKTNKVVGEDIIQSQNIDRYGKVFKFVGVIDTSVNKLAEELHFKFDSITAWNPVVKHSKLIQKIDNHTDVCYLVVAEAAGGLVSSRDFVNVRIWQKRDSTLVCASMATIHPEYPPNSKYIRGEQGPSVYVLTPVEGDSNKCHMQWLSTVDLKGWLPQYLIDLSIAGSMLDFIHHLRKYLNDNRNVQT